MLQEEDSFLKDFSSYWLKNFLKKKKQTMYGKSITNKKEIQGQVQP